MKKAVTLISFLFVLTQGLYAQNNVAKHINSSELIELKEKDKTTLLIDIRTPNEFNAGHLEGAKHIDFYNSDFYQQMSKLDKSKKVIIYCAVGGRSGVAFRKLKNMGFQHLYDYAGGFSDWKQQNLPFVK